MFVWPILILSYASNVTNIFCWKHIYRPMNYLCLKHISRNAKKSVSALYSLLYFNQSKWPILNVRLCGIFFVRFQFPSLELEPVSCLDLDLFGAEKIQLKSIFFDEEGHSLQFALLLFSWEFA